MAAVLHSVLGSVSLSATFSCLFIYLFIYLFFEISGLNHYVLVKHHAYPGIYKSRPICIILKDQFLAKT